MRKKNRILSILLVLVMLFSSAAMSAFAVTGDEGQGLQTPANFKALPGHQSVLLKWDKVANATKYIITRDDGIKYETAETQYYDEDVKKTEKENDVVYSYTVQAVNGTEQSAPTAASEKVGRVRTAYYKCTFRAGVKLKSHDKAKKAHKFKKGDIVYAEGYGTGAYKFRYNGRPYEAKWFRMKKVKVLYKKNAYTAEVAENYVNQGGYKSPTRYLIWISIYSQKVFLFEGRAGEWKCIREESCNTGAGKSPTPTGFNKKIGKQMKRYSSHKWWSCFSSFNAIHGRNKNDAKAGKPISNGCVRVSNEMAQWIMKNCKKKTKVIAW